jgi:hypothetical protein
MNEQELFWSKVDRSQYSPAGCWLWLGNKDRRFISESGKNFRAHVFAFTISGGILKKNAKPTQRRSCCWSY